MWRQCGIWHWSWFCEATDYEISPTCGSKICNEVIPSQSPQHRMNGPSSNRSWRFLTPFWYRTQWMSKRHTVTLHCVIIIYNGIVDHMDGVMWFSNKKKTQWNGHLYLPVTFACQKLSKYYTKVTFTMGRLHISAQFVDPFLKLWYVLHSDMGMDIYYEDETAYTTQFEEAFLMYVENQYCTKHWRLPVINLDNVPSNNPFSSKMNSRYVPSSYDPNDLSSNDVEYVMPNNVAKTTTGWSDHTACL